VPPDYFAHPRVGDVFKHQSEQVVVLDTSVGVVAARCRHDKFYLCKFATIEEFAHLFQYLQAPGYCGKWLETLVEPELWCEFVHGIPPTTLQSLLRFLAIPIVQSVELDCAWGCTVFCAKIFVTNQPLQIVENVTPTNMVSRIVENLPPDVVRSLTTYFLESRL